MYTFSLPITKVLKLLRVSLLLLPFILMGSDSIQYYNLNRFDQGIVLNHFEVDIPGFKGGTNPAMIKLGEKILMAFRYTPPYLHPSNSFICTVLLDKNFKPIGPAIPLNLRQDNPFIPSRAEDPRLIENGGKIYLLYNDNLDKEIICGVRREMFITELRQDGQEFTASIPVLLKHPENYPSNPQEKNWEPFVFAGTLLLGYSINPHEILLPDLISGECSSLYSTQIDPEFLGSQPYQWGYMKGSSTPIRYKEYYLGLFHAFKVIFSNVSITNKLHHYFFGAYLYRSKPPFDLVAMSPHPIVGQNLYTPSSFHKRVIFPSGLFIENGTLVVCYGKDDSSIYITKLDLQKLIDSLLPIPLCSF